MPRDFVGELVEQVVGDPALDFGVHLHHADVKLRTVLAEAQVRISMPEIRGEYQLGEGVLQLAQALVAEAIAEAPHGGARHVRPLGDGAHADRVRFAHVGHEVARDRRVIAVMLLVDYRADDV